MTNSRDQAAGMAFAALAASLDRVRHYATQTESQRYDELVAMLQDEGTQEEAHAGLRHLNDIWRTRHYDAMHG